MTWWRGDVVAWWRGGVVAWWRGGGVVAWWRGGVVAWWRGGVVAWWRGGVVAWWRGGVVAWWRGVSTTHGYETVWLISKYRIQSIFCRTVCVGRLHSFRNEAGRFGETTHTRYAFILEIALRRSFLNKQIIRVGELYNINVHRNVA